MKFKTTIVFVALYTCSSFANIPKVLEQQFLNQNIPVQEVVFKNRHLYLVDLRKQCCDLGAQVYTKEGDFYCGLVGIAGAWTDNCIGFDEQVKYIKTYKPNVETK